MHFSSCARALAVLSLASSGSLWAQSQVTLYGIVDTHLEYLNNLPQTNEGTTSLLRIGHSGLQGPRLGFRGAEDLGSGWKAIFTLEHGFSSDTGAPADAARFFNRSSFVGLESKQHRLTLGRQYTTLFDALAYTTPLAYAGTYEPFSPLLGNLRNDNSVKYRFASDGWQAQMHYAFGEQTSSQAANAAWGASVSYVAHGLHATLAADQQNGADVDGGRARSRKIAVGAAYRLNPALRLSAGYRWGENRSATGLIALRDDFWWLGVSYQASAPLALNLGYYQNSIKTRNGVGDQATPRQLSAQAIYALSKRTDLYAAASHARKAGLNFAALATLAPGAQSQSGIAMGIRHRF